MDSFSGIKSGDIIFRNSYVRDVVHSDNSSSQFKGEYYFRLTLGVILMQIGITLLFVELSIGAGVIWSDRIIFNVTFIWSNLIMYLALFIFGFIILIKAVEARSEYFVIYYNDCLMFCLIKKHLFRKAEIHNCQVQFQSVLNFQFKRADHEGYRDYILIHFRDKERDTIAIQQRIDSLSYYLNHDNMRWYLLKVHESHANEIVDFLNERVQDNKFK
jgi:hypothetical protein